MPVLDLLGFEVEHHDIIGVDSDTLEAHNDVIVVVRCMLILNLSVMVLLLMLLSSFHNEEVAISDIKLVLPLDQEAALMWVLLVDSKKIVSKLFLALVSEDKEALSVRSDGLNAGDVTLCINIEFLLTFGFRQIDVQGIVLGAEDELVLILVENGILWSFSEWIIILVNRFDLFRFIIVVEFEELVILEEKESIRVILIKLELDAGISELPVSQLFNLEFSRGVLLVDSDFGDRNLILDQFLSDGYTNLLLILRNGLIEDLDAFITVWDLPLLQDDAEVLVVIDDDIGFISHHISIIRSKILS